jgi:glucan 1,3-beta-glucosidase
MKLRGVNLGGWLLLEKWITPSLFEGVAAEDEYSFSIHDAQNEYRQLREHRNSFITKKDFAWLAKADFNAVRLPIGYWALDDEPPYLNCQELLDKAFQWADEFGLAIILDLHGAPGSQNGLDHSGKGGAVEWTNHANVKRTLEVLETLAKRYCNQGALWGINLLNEPSQRVPLDLLREFYISGYEKVREYCNESVAIIISDTFRPQAWNDFMNEPVYKNVVLDMHLYQCFSAADKALSLAGHLQKTKVEWAKIIKHSDKPVMICEWSLGLDASTFAGMKEDQKKPALQAYADAQTKVFNQAAGWFFWNYKTENMSGWDLRYLVDSNLLRG